MHISSHPIHRLHDASLPINHIALPARNILRPIEQQQASPQPIASRRHHGLKPLVRLSKNHGDRLRPRPHSIHIAEQLHFRSRQRQTSSVHHRLGFQRRINRLHALQGQQIARIKNPKQRRPPHRGSNDLLVFLSTIHRHHQRTPRQLALPIDSPVRRIRHRPSLRIEPIRLQPHRLSVDDTRLNPGNGKPPRVIRRRPKIRPHPSQRRMAQPHPHQRPDRRLIRQIAARPVVVHLPANGAKRIIAPSPRLQVRVVNERRQHGPQQRDLTGQPVKAHRPRIIVGRVKASAAVVDRAKGQRRTSSESRYRRIQRHRQAHSS